MNLDSVPLVVLISGDSRPLVCPSCSTKVREERDRFVQRHPLASGIDVVEDEMSGTLDIDHDQIFHTDEQGRRGTRPGAWISAGADPGPR